MWFKRFMVVYRSDDCQFMILIRVYYHQSHVRGSVCCMTFYINFFVFFLYFRWAFFTEYTCEPYIISTMKAAVGSLWGNVITSLVTLSFILTPVKIKKVNKEHLNLETSESYFSATKKNWSSR